MATKSQLPWNREAVILSVTLFSLQTPSITSASAIGHRISELTSRPGHRISELTSRPGHRISELTSRPGHRISELTSRPGHRMSELTSRPGHRISELTSRPGHRMSELTSRPGHRISELTSRPGHRISELTSRPGHRISELTSRPGHRISELTSRPGHGDSMALQSLWEEIQEDKWIQTEENSLRKAEEESNVSQLDLGTESRDTKEADGATTRDTTTTTFSAENGRHGKDVCDNGYVDGCSVPLGMAALFKGEFTPACNRHDICYRCGRLYGITQKECDSMFLTNMFHSCYGNNDLIESPKTREQAESLNAILVKAMDNMTRTKESEDKDLQQLGLVPGVDEAVSRKVTAEQIVILSQLLKRLNEDCDLGVAEAVSKKATSEQIVLLSQLLKRLNEDGDTNNNNEVCPECPQLQKPADDENSLAAKSNDFLHQFWSNLHVCRVAAQTFYGVVRVLGVFNFRKDAKHWCRESYVSGCLG